jgi:hypothetical protein
VLQGRPRATFALRSAEMVRLKARPRNICLEPEKSESVNRLANSNPPMVKYQVNHRLIVPSAPRTPRRSTHIPMPRPSGLCRITYRPTPPAPCIRRSRPPKPGGSCGGSSSILPRRFCHRFSTSHRRKLSSMHSRGERILAESPTRTLPKSHNHCAGVLVGPINIRCNCLDDLIHCGGVVSQGGAPRCGLPRRVIQRSAVNTRRECHALGCVLGGGDLDRLAGHGHYTTAVVDRRDCHLGLAGRAGLAASASATGLSASRAST